LFGITLAEFEADGDFQDALRRDLYDATGGAEAGLTTFGSTRIVGASYGSSDPDPLLPERIIFRQTAPTTMTVSEALSLNANDPDSENFSILNRLGSFQDAEGRFTLRLVYPRRTGNNYNTWRQTSNPLDGRVTGGVDGFEALDGPVWEQSRQLQASGWSEADAIGYCNRLGSAWSIAHIDSARGSLYCMYGGTQTNANCNYCDTYRIVVWKHGGGETLHDLGSYPFATIAGRVYTAHTNPCAIGPNTLQHCDNFPSPTTSPTTAPTTAPSESFHVNWEGLEYNTGSESLLDGSGNFWYFAVGVHEIWEGGFPGPVSHYDPSFVAGETQVELYAVVPEIAVGFTIGFEGRTAADAAETALDWSFGNGQLLGTVSIEPFSALLTPLVLLCLCSYFQTMCDPPLSTGTFVLLHSLLSSSIFSSKNFSVCMYHLIITHMTELT